MLGGHVSSTDNPVGALFDTQIPDEVWHYTTVAGLEGMLSSGKVWATDVRFTNDKTEFIHAREVIEEYLTSVKTNESDFMFPAEELSRMLYKAFDQGALSSNENNVYVASFSAADDLKSQWVEYADNCRGVSIAFDLRNIRPPKDAELAVTFAPCVYAKADKARLIDASLSNFTERAAELDRESGSQGWMADQKRTWEIIQRIHGLPNDKDGLVRKLEMQFQDQLLEAWRRTLFDLLRVASHCKSDAFSAELEWRLAMARPKNRPLTQKILFRGAKGNIPYLESNLFQPTSQLPIARVRTGPLCDQTNEVQRILDANGYSVPVIPSTIPLRDTRSAF
jgi:hypothetical protein